MKSVYDEQYAWAARDPQSFWAAAAADLYWDKRWDRVLDDSRPPYYRWFAGGRLNTCYNAVDLHVDRGRGKQLALIYDSPVTGTVKTLTYAALQDEVARFGGALRRLGVGQADRVIIYMPDVRNTAWYVRKVKGRVTGEGPVSNVTSSRSTRPYTIAVVGRPDGSCTNTARGSFLCPFRTSRVTGPGRRWPAPSMR